MPLVNVKFIITARLLAQYGNFRILPTSSGGVIRRPAKYLREVVEVAPLFITIENIEYEMMLTEFNSIIRSIEFNKEYLDYVDDLDDIDTGDIKMPERIPVSEVPLEYVTVENGKTNKHIITPDGIDGYKDSVPGIDAEDDDDSVSVEAVCRYLSPNFILQKSDWYHSIDLYEWEFVSKEKAGKGSYINTKVKPFKQLLNKMINSKSKHD